MCFRQRHKVEVLDSEGRAVVVQLADRAYPGVVFQGDTLKVLLDGIDSIVARAQQNQDERLLKNAHRLQGLLRPVFDEYNETRKRHGRGGF